jgi:hypothetical protein
MLPQQAAEKLIGAVILRSQQAVLSLAKEESRIAVKTLRARSFAAAQDDSIGAFFRSLLEHHHPMRCHSEPIFLGEEPP